MTSQCFDIVRRSDAKDGVVPPEPAGPMEVAPQERSYLENLTLTRRWLSPMSPLATSIGDSIVISGGDQ